MIHCEKESIKISKVDKPYNTTSTAEMNLQSHNVHEVNKLV